MTPLDPIRLSYVLRIRTTLNKIPAHKFLHVLDVGCGRGIILSKILRANPDAQGVGLDLNLDDLRFLRKSKSVAWKRLDLVRGDARYLPFKSESFDLVIATEVIEHLKTMIEGLRMIREISRVQKSGGYLVISTPNRFRFSYIFSKILKKLTGGRILRFHSTEYSSYELKYLLQSTGLRLQKFEYMVFPPDLLGTLSVLGIGIEGLPSSYRKLMKLFSWAYLILDRATSLPLLKVLLKSNMIAVAYRR